MHLFGYTIKIDITFLPTADEKCKSTGVCNDGECVSVGAKHVCSCNDGFRMNTDNICVKEKCPVGETKDENGFCVVISMYICLSLKQSL